MGGGALSSACGEDAAGLSSPGSLIWEEVTVMRHLIIVREHKSCRNTLSQWHKWASRTKILMDIFYLLHRWQMWKHPFHHLSSPVTTRSPRSSALGDVSAPRRSLSCWRSPTTCSTCLHNGVSPCCQLVAKVYYGVLFQNIFLNLRVPFCI